MKQVLKEYYKTNLGTWYEPLEEFLYSKEMENIRLTLFQDRKSTNVFPSSNNIFKVFNYIDYNNVRVIILGEDPYPKKGYNTGIPYCSGKTYPLPTSLFNIVLELENDVFNGLYMDRFLIYDLTHWVTQGILMLNTGLTVKENQAQSHNNLWKPFIKEIFKILSNKTGLIYVLWGKQANEFKQYINPNHNYIIESASPVNEKEFLGSKPFSKINDIIEKQNGKDFIIKWQI